MKYNDFLLLVLGCVIGLAVWFIFISPIRVNPPASVGSFQATETAGGEFVLDTRDGHSYLVMPEGVIDMGTLSKPDLKIVKRTLPDIRSLEVR